MRGCAEVHGRGGELRWGRELRDVVSLLFIFLLFFLPPFCSKSHVLIHPSGRAFSPRLLFTWPNARTSVMGAEQLSSVMEAVGKKVDPELKSRIERESEVKFGSARLWDDGVIRPEDTRAVLGVGLQMAMGGLNVGKEKETRWGVFRM